MTIESIKIIRGDTFYASGVYKDSAGDPVNLTLAATTVAASARDPNGLVSIDLVVTPDPNQISNPGAFTVVGETVDWVSDSPVGAHWNVRLHYTSSLGRFSSAAVNVELTP